MNIYPSKGGYTEQLLFEALSKKLITEEERKEVYQIKSVAVCSDCGEEYNYTADDKLPDKCETINEKGKPCVGKYRASGRVAWRTKDDKGKEIPQEKDVTIGEMANYNITKALNELEEAEGLDPSVKTLYKKIVLEGKDPDFGLEDITLIGLSEEKVAEVKASPKPKVAVNK